MTLSENVNLKTNPFGTIANNEDENSYLKPEFDGSSSNNHNRNYFVKTRDPDQSKNESVKLGQAVDLPSITDN